MVRFVADDLDLTRAWFDSLAATVWREQEAALLADILPQLTGYRCVQLGVGPLAPEMRDRLDTLRFWRADVRAESGVDLRIDGQNLPWMTGSLDALIVVHGLELSADPHALVRECARVLSPRGQLVCVAFNPLSIWMLRQRLRGGNQRFAPRSVPPRAARLADWLRVLDFEATACWRYGPGLPLFGRRWRVGHDKRWLASLAWSAGGYALVARRRTLQCILPPGRGVLAKPKRGHVAPKPAAGLPSRG